MRRATVWSHLEKSRPWLCFVSAYPPRPLERESTKSWNSSAQRTPSRDTTLIRATACMAWTLTWWVVVNVSFIFSSLCGWLCLCVHKYEMPFVLFPRCWSSDLLDDVGPHQSRASLLTPQRRGPLRREKEPKEVRLCVCAFMWVCVCVHVFTVYTQLGACRGHIRISHYLKGVWHVYGSLFHSCCLLRIEIYHGKSRLQSKSKEFVIYSST